MNSFDKLFIWSVVSFVLMATIFREYIVLIENENFFAIIILLFAAIPFSIMLVYPIVILFEDKSTKGENQK